MPSGLSQSHQEIAGQSQWELLQLTCLGSDGQQHVQRAPAAPAGTWDGRLDCSVPAILLRAKKSEVLLTAQIS